MKTFLSWATYVAMTVAIALPTAHAQRPSGTSVAVIDLGEVFRKYDALTAQLEGVKKDIQDFEARIRADKQKIEALAEQLKTLNPGKPDYVEKEKAFASMQANLQVLVRQKSREFLEREAKIRYRAYQDIQKQVAKFCETYGIQLVIRFSRQPIDSSKPQAVQVGLNRPIVYQNSLDITSHIIKALQGGSATARRPGPAIPSR